MSFYFQGNRGKTSYFIFYPANTTLFELTSMEVKMMTKLKRIVLDMDRMKGETPS